jgi:hypothetical protein
MLPAAAHLARAVFEHLSSKDLAMDSALACLVLLTSGVNFGWQPASNDPAGYEYTVQVEPELLEKLQRGESVPIESNVPSEVTPIRKVRIVAGNAELPRLPLAADAKKLEKYVAKDARAAAPVIRGQSPDDTAGGKAVPRTANFAGDNVWGTGTSTPDRYNQPAGSVAPPPPSFLERSQTAVTETGTSLQQGINSGFQSASQQFQGISNSASQQLQQAGNSVGISSSGITAPPSWPTSATAPAGTAKNAAIVQTASGWTSIGGNLPAPPLMTPMSSVSSTSTSRTAALSSPTNAGPSFPPPPVASAEPQIRSVLVDPNGSTTASGGQWPASSGTSVNSGQPGISRSGSNDNGLVPVQPIPGMQSTSQQRYTDPWDRTGAPSLTPSAVNTVGTGLQPAASPSITNNNNGLTQPNSTVPMNTAAAPPAASQAPNNTLTQRQPTNLMPQGEERPWLPLLVVSLSLIGSLSANFFLGWSYMDARQRYSSLVYRTASAFRRTTSDAA